MHMIELNQSLFSKLYLQAYGDNSVRFHAYIETSQDDKDLIVNAKSIITLQSLELKIAIIVMKDDSQFLAIIGAHQFSTLPPEVRLQRLDESAGALTILGGSGALASRDSYNFMDLTWSTIKSNERGSRHNITPVNKNEAIEIFEDFSFYRVDALPFAPIDGGEDRFLLLLLLLLDIGDREKLELKSVFLDMLINLDRFPFHLLHSAYISQTWQYSYIDIYRCIELLYPIPRMMELRDLVGERIGDSLNARVLAINLFKDVNQATGWREIELSGLERLIKLCSQENISTVFDVLANAKIVNGDELEIIKELSKVELMKLGIMKPLFEVFRDKLSRLDVADVAIVSEYKTKRSAALIANALYSTRNELVHFRLPSESIDRDRIKTSLKALLCILTDLYRKFQREAYA